MLGHDYSDIPTKSIEILIQLVRDLHLKHIVFTSAADTTELWLKGLKH